MMKKVKTHRITSPVAKQALADGVGTKLGSFLDHGAEQQVDFLHSRIHRLDPDIAEALLEYLQAKPVAVGSICSGTDSPVLAAKALDRAAGRYAKDHSLPYTSKLRHIFSCEKSGWKRSFLQQVFPRCGKEDDMQKTERAHCSRKFKG